MILLVDAALLGGITVGEGESIDVVLTNGEWRANKGRSGEVIHNARVSYSDFNRWSVFGNVVVSSDGNSFRLVDDRYDFDYKYNFKYILRDLETLIGNPGKGTPYRIEYKVAPDLPITH